MQGWDNITLENLIELVALSNDATLSPLDKQVKLLALITNNAEDYILDLSRPEFLKLSAKYNFIADLPVNKPVQDFKCAGYEWKVQKDISKLTTSDYINLSELVKDDSKSMENIPKMLAIFCEPYKSYPLFIKRKSKMDYSTKVELLKKAKASDVYPLSLFFCRLLIHLTKDIEGYLAEEIQKMTKNLNSQIPSLNSGVGI